MKIKAVIFDLDGVIVSTDRQHYLAWKAIADREGFAFDETVNHRLRGVGRMESLEIILEHAGAELNQDRKEALAQQKNSLYRDSLEELTPRDILPGVEALLKDLKAKGMRTAIGSSSRNAETILRQVGLESAFDAVVGGKDIQRGKPDPEVFLLAAQRLGVEPSQCLVVEDAEAGIEAGKRAGMMTLGVGGALGDAAPDWRLRDLTESLRGIL